MRLVSTTRRSHVFALLVLTAAVASMSWQGVFAQDVTQPGDPVVPTSANSPAAEQAANAIDDLVGTKYLNFDIVNAGLTIWPQVGVTRVSGLTLASANDHDERDPASFLLEGSNDAGQTFTTIASGAVPAFAGRFYQQELSFPNTSAFRTYRLTFPDVVNAGTANSMQIAEIGLLGEALPTIRTDITRAGDPVVPSSANSPAAEQAPMAIDNTMATKYLNFDIQNTGLTVWPQAGWTKVSGIGLTSANDHGERDPVNFILEGSNDAGQTFTQIAAGTVAPFPSRFQEHDIFFANDQSYAQYRFTFPDVADAGTANSMQIAEVQLFGEFMPTPRTDVTQPGDPITPTSTNSPAAEGVANAIDDTFSAKYLNFDILNTGFTVIPQAGMTRVTGLGLTSANDHAERDPANFTLEGSNDGGATFQPIASGVVPAFPNRYQEHDIFFDNSQQYGVYRVIFPDVADASTANSMQIAEVQLFGDVVSPVRTDITQPSDPIVGSSTNTPAAEGVANAIDDTAATKYLNFDKLGTGLTVWPQLGFTTVTGLGLTSANDAPERDPISYVLEGSNDGGNTFTQIAAGAAPSFSSRQQPRDVFFANADAYAMYRLTFPDVADAGAANSMQIAEVQLYGQPAPTLRVDVTKPSDPIVPTSANSPAAEGVANAIDGAASTKYLNFDKVNTGFTIWPQAGFTRITGLSLTSANDAPERDPVNFVLEGSNDGGNTFSPILSASAPPFTTRFQERDLFFANDESYAIYRLTFPDVADAAAANSMQIAEVELFGEVLPTIRTDVTQPGDLIIPSSTNSPGAEGVANAIDDNTLTKYLNFDEQNTGFTVFPSAGRTRISGLSLTSANDAAERDPASFLLEGTNNGLDFTEIASGQVPGFSGRFTTLDLFFAPAEYFNGYRLTFPDVVDAATANSMQIAEVQLFGTVFVPEPSTMALAGLGLLGLLGYAVRRRRRPAA